MAGQADAYVFVCIFSYFCVLRPLSEIVVKMKLSGKILLLLLFSSSSSFFFGSSFFVVLFKHKTYT